MADKFVTAHVGAKKAEARVNDIFAIRRDSGGSFPKWIEHEWAESDHKVIKPAHEIPSHHLGRNLQRLLPQEIVYALEKLGTKMKWPQKMKSDPSTRKSNVLYKFHQERGHKTEDCIALRQEVVNMLHQGHLTKLMSDRGRANFGRGREQHQGPPKPPSPARAIQMIISRGDEAVINHVKFTTTDKLKRSITHEWYDYLEDSIIFDKLDTHDLSFPHFDALVTTLRISDTDVKRIIVEEAAHVLSTLEFSHR
uniref:Uncharacterized protein n=1 Tax=Nicotiana tabacum TaxID=4097 RepID=A0A1S4C9V2_TOBAC|nr:PREDICTED: uncharacterized protein LOC107816788 [Nicotiana tabacum]